MPRSAGRGIRRSSTRSAGLQWGDAADRLPRMNPFAKWWWWTLDYVAAAVGQLRGWRLRVIPEAYSSGDASLPVVVLIPGVYERWGFLGTLAAALNSRGYRILVVPALKDNRIEVTAAASLVRSAIRDAGPDRYVIVGHSKGGLIGKAVLTAGVIGAKLVGLVAIATPFAGSAYARYLPGRTLRGLAPDDATIAALASELDANRRIISIQPRFDPHIPGDRTLEGAEVVTLAASGHFRVLGHHATVEAVVDALRRLQHAG